VKKVKKIISSDLKKLNIWFSEDVINEIISASMKNAFLVQYICKNLLMENNVNETQPKEKKIDDINKARTTFREIANKLDNDYNDIYNLINAGVRKQQENKAFNQYEEILKVLKDKNIEDLEKGIHCTDIYKSA
jgi:hypothetical protein